MKKFFKKAARRARETRNSFIVRFRDDLRRAKARYLKILEKHYLWVGGEEALDEFFLFWIRFKEGESKELPKFRILAKESGRCIKCYDFHLSRLVTVESIMTFSSLDSQPTKQSLLVRELLENPGVAQVELRPYEITIKKAEVFEWEEILPEAERIIRKYLECHNVADYTVFPLKKAKAAYV